MAFGPVNVGGGASVSTVEKIYESISKVREDAKAALDSHTGAKNPHGITAEDVGAAAASHSHSFENLSGNVFHAGTTAPSNKGLLWIDTTANTGGLKYYNGSAWVHVPVAYT